MPSLTMEEQKALIMAIARGRVRSHRQRLEMSEQRGGSDFVRDGFNTSEANDVLAWATSMEAVAKNPMVRLLVEEQLDIVGLNTKGTQTSPVMRWSHEYEDAEEYSEPETPLPPVRPIVR